MIDPKVFKTMALNMIWPFLAVIAVVAILLLIKLSLRRRKLAKLSRAGIGDIDKMDGRTFEQYVESIYKRKGYKTKRTPYKGDFGGDVIIEKDGVKAVVQAKRWKRRLGVKAVQEVVAARGDYGCDEAIVLSNSDFTEQAVELARRNRVTLVGRKRLLDEFVALAESLPQK